VFNADIHPRTPPLRSLRHPLCVLCVFPLRFPCASLAPKIFSNHWKTAEEFFQSLEKSAHFFQPLEKNFPIIGKTARNFPTNGVVRLKASHFNPCGGG
jgi:hypothetical protein